MSRLRTAIVALGLATFLTSSGARAQSLIPGGSWSGPYWGLTGGGVWSDLKDARNRADLAWSAHAGYGLQIASLYLGGEIDGTWGGTRSGYFLSPLYSSTLELDWSATARARVGLVIGGALLYATGGVVWSGQTLGIHTLGGPPTASSRSVPGAVIGGGIELKILPFLSARLEALHYDYSSQSAKFLDNAPGGIPAAAWRRIDFDETVVRAGLSLRLN